MAVHTGGRGPGHLCRKGPGAFSPGGTPAGTARSATDYFVRTTGPTTYPPLVDFNAMVDWIDGDQLVCQRSQDATFATGTSETIVTLAAATVTYNLGLGGISSGSWFFRIAAWTGGRPVSLNWSAILNVGDVVAPTITSSATQTAMSIALTADEGVTWAIVGGADAASWQTSGSTLSHIATAATQSVHAVQVQATDYAGNVSSIQSITITLDITPTAFTFTDITGATVSTQYTSNTITVAGLGSGVTVAVSGGPYSKNGGAYTSASGTAVNGDTFSTRITSSGSGGTGVGASLSVGTFSDTYTVTTAGFTPADLWTASEPGDWWDITDMSTMFQDAACTIPVTTNSGTQNVKGFVGKKNGNILIPRNTNGATLKTDGTNNYFDFVVNGALSSGYYVASLQVQSATTGAWTMAVAPYFSDTTARNSIYYDNGSSSRVGRLPSATDAQALAAGTGFITDSAGGTIVANTAFRHMGTFAGTGGNVEAYFNNTSNGGTSCPGTTPKAASAFCIMNTNGGTYYAGRLYGGIIGIGRACNSTELTNIDTWLDARS